MFNFRTQHLRGTTAEWENSSLIPKQGELVFEECSDGVTRIKIGNGGSLFKDLKYVDEKTAQQLIVLQNQINQIVADDSVDKNTVESEVENIRVGYDGHIYPQAGEAVRAVGKHLLSLEEGLADFIGEHAVNGLHYENDWLYLKTGEQILEESGVHIVSGGGGGGGTSTLNDLKISYITSSPITCTPKDQVIIEFNFTGKDSSGDVISQVNATWEVDKKVVAYSTVKDGYNSFDVTPYLKVGQNQIKLTVTDDVGTRQFKTWRADKIDLRLEVVFDDTKSYDVNELVIINCIPYGAVDKDLHVCLDGEDIPNSPIHFPKRFSGPSSQTPIELPKVSHGTHKLEAYLKAKIDGVNDSYSETVVKNIIYYDSADSTPIIKLSNSLFAVKQHDTVKIDYTVYDPQSNQPVVDIYINDQYKESQTLSTSTASYSYLASETGTYSITFVCRTTSVTANITVEEVTIPISPVQTGLAFDFNPVGLSNDSINREWTDGTVHMTVSENFDWINGGYRYDENNTPYFCVKAGTRAIFDYKLFGKNATKTGREFKVIFKTTNVGDPSKSFLSCMDDSSNIGIDMRMHEANVSGNNGSLELSYSENDKIEFEFNISPYTPTIVGSIPLVMGYEDGVATRPLVYDDSWSFEQTNYQDIVVGSDYCDVYIYRMKAYDTALTDAQILNNFITDASTADEMLRRYKRNAFYEENSGELDPQTVAKLCPDLRVYILSAPKFTSDKKEKIDNTTIQQIYTNGDPILDNWTCYNATHSGQGTSSNDYGPAGRNLDFIMNGKSSYFVLGDGSTTTKEITLTRTSVPTAYLNAKVNIASSNNLTNAMLAKHYNTHNPYKRPLYDRISENGYFDRDSEGNIFNRSDIPLEWVKDTMEFYNCAIFIQETHTDISEHREFEDTAVHFYALGNIGDSKKTDGSRLTDPADKFECCVEIMDVDKVLSAFPKDTMRNVKDDYVVDKVTGEKIYTWVKNDNLHILHEKLPDESYIITSDVEVSHDKDYYVDMLENDDFSEAFTYGWRYLWEEGSDAENKIVFDYCKSKWIEFYRFVTNSTDEYFKEHLKDYFVVESALYYYLFTTRYCMVDNRAKNTFWHYGVAGVFDANGNQIFDDAGRPVIATDEYGLPVRKWDLCWDYDNDTSLGLNNYGKQVYRYGLEDSDLDETGREIFRQSDSLFFCRIRDLFDEELSQLYNNLEQSQKNPWSANTFLTACDDWQDQFSEELWRQDIQRKYIRTYTQSFINGIPEPRFLVNMSNGKMKYHRRQWERSQEFYMASKYQTLTASNNAVKLRASAPENYVVTPSYNLTLTPCMYMYLNVDYGGQFKNIVSERVKNLNETISIKMPSGVTKADIINVWSASGLADIGDVSPVYTEELVVSAAKRLKDVIAGNSTPGYANAGLTSIAVNTPLLEKLNIQNVTGLRGSLDLTGSSWLNLPEGLLNLKYLYARGANISSVLLPPGGKIEYLELPSVTTTLKFDSLKYLSNDNIVIYDEETVLNQYPKVTTLFVKDCPLIDGLALLEKCPNITDLTLTDINFGSYTFEDFRDKFFNLNTCYLTGNIFFRELTGTQYTDLRTRFPELSITYGDLTCTVNFYYSDGTLGYGPLYIFNEGSIVDDPVLSGMMGRPVKESTPQYNFTWSGWSDKNDGVIVDTDFFNEVTNDYDLYPTYEATVRRYTVEFCNNNGTVLQTTEVEYGTPEVVYSGEPFEKEDTTSPQAFKHVGWLPEPKNITDNLKTYAVYSLDKNKLETITLNQFAYEKDDLHKTMSIVEYPLDPATAPQVIRIADKYSIDGIEGEYTVTSIQARKTAEGTYTGFQNAGLEYVELPETVQTVGSYTFRDNKLTEITIPESVTTLGKQSFANMPLQNVYYNAIKAYLKDAEDTSINLAPFNNVTTDAGYNVHIGPNVEVIGHHVFYPSTSVDNSGHIAKLIFSDSGKCKEIEYSAFYGSGCNEVIFQNTPIIKIGSNAFNNCNLKTVELPNTLEELGSSVFYGNLNLSAIKIPPKLKKIGAGAFAQCHPSLNFDIASNHTYFRWSNNCLFGTVNNKEQNGVIVYGRDDGSGTVSVTDKGITTIGASAFRDGVMTHVILPDGIVAIKEYAFSTCKQLTNIELPSTLVSIGYFAFEKCAFEYITLPESLTQLNYYAFARNAKLKEITIPKNVTSLGIEVFKDCTSLEKVVVETPTNNWTQTSAKGRSLQFTGCTHLANIKVAIDSTAPENETLVNDAPWGAGMTSETKEVVTREIIVEFTDKKVKYVYDDETEEYIPNNVTE